MTSATGEVGDQKADGALQRRKAPRCAAALDQVKRGCAADGPPISSISPRTTSSSTASRMTTRAVGLPQNTARDRL
jgi:hypothetical protein